MEGLSYKVRISVLWILFIITYFIYRTLALSVDATNVSILGNVEFASMMLALMLFTVLTLTLDNKTNRTVNMVAGGVFFAVQVIMLIDGMVGYSSEPFNWMTAASLVITALVFYFALRWPKQVT
jgi:hypothetical protein